MKYLKTTLLLLAFVLANGFCFAQQQPDKDTTQYGHNAAAGKFVTLRGINMYYEVYGKGEPLLIIHGNGNSIKNFRYQIPYFAKNYQVILADSRAQGKTVDIKDSLSYEMMTDDLNALLEHLKLKNVSVIGWSDGGIEGLLLAINHPDKVKKLAVTGANLWPDTSAVDPDVYNMAFRENQMADSVKKHRSLTADEKNQAKLLHLLTYEPHIKVASLKKIACPTLVIGGDHDILLPKHTMLIADNIPNSYLWILPNSGHSTPVYYRDMFNKVVGDFLSKPYRKIEKEGRFN